MVEISNLCTVGGYRRAVIDPTFVNKLYIYEPVARSEAFTEVLVYGDAISTIGHCRKHMAQSNKVKNRAYQQFRSYSWC
jgi:hypothetical protein